MRSLGYNTAAGEDRRELTAILSQDKTKERKKVCVCVRMCKKHLPSVGDVLGSSEGEGDGSPLGSTEGNADGWPDGSIDRLGSSDG